MAAVAGEYTSVYVIGFSILFMKINSFNPINVLYYTLDRITVENSNATQDWFATVCSPLPVEFSVQITDLYECLDCSLRSKLSAGSEATRCVRAAILRFLIAKGHH